MTMLLMITPTSVKGSGYPLLHFAPYHMGISNDCYRLTNEHTYLALSLSLSLSLSLTLSLSLSVLES